MKILLSIFAVILCGCTYHPNTEDWARTNEKVQQCTQSHMRTRITIQADDMLSVECTP
jgi:hypothetical protein